MRLILASAAAALATLAAPAQAATFHCPSGQIYRVSQKKCEARAVAAKQLHAIVRPGKSERVTRVQRIAAPTTLKASEKPEVAALGAVEAAPPPAPRPVVRPAIVADPAPSPYGALR